MSGHNKWSQIKHKKAKEDAKKGKQFTKLIKEITVAAREHGGDLAANARLRHLVEKAKQINMPQENIVRAIKRGTGELPGGNYQPFTYEGYGPHGIAILVESLSDNKNRTVADLRHIFSKGNGNLGESGSVAWMFYHIGVIRATGTISEDALLEALLDYNIIDIKKDESHFTIQCDPKSLDAIKKSTQAAGLTIESAEMEWVAKNAIELSDDQSEKVLDLLSTLDDHEDVQEVYSNLA